MTTSTITWTSDELTRLGNAEEVRIASARSDGTLRKPRIVWIVRNGGDLYVRSVGGRNAAWFRGAIASHAGHVRGSGVQKDVAFVETDERGDEVDAAYRAKYSRRYPSIVPSIVRPEARAATLRLVSRAATA